MTDAYSKIWRAHRKWRRLTLMAFLGYLPFGMCAGAFERWIGIKDIGFWIAAPWFCFWVVCVFKLAGLRCPQCGKRFYSRSAAGNPLSPWCMNCGLKRGTPAPASKDGTE
jgi:hypothetical protein